MKSVLSFVASLSVCTVFCANAQSPSCDGAPHALDYGASRQRAFLLSDGSLATRSRVAVNVDGMKHAYHRDGIAGGGLISLCNGGKPYPAGRPPYNASASNAACHRFATDYAAIKQAGWKNPAVGAIHWFGILGTDSVKIDGRSVSQVVPVEQPDGSGFFVSPTSLEDKVNYPDPKDQRRYIDAETVPAAVIRNSAAMQTLGIRMGSYGVAIHRNHRIAVPFVVGDFGPRIGEGSYALGRMLKGLPFETATRKNVYSGHIEEKDVLWVFFGGDVAVAPYTAERIRDAAETRFRAWGGMPRLETCLANPAIPTAD